LTLQAGQPKDRKRIAGYLGVGETIHTFNLLGNLLIYNAVGLAGCVVISKTADKILDN